MQSTTTSECRLRDGEHSLPKGKKTCESTELTCDRHCGCPQELPISEQSLQWFAIRVTYSREMRLKAYLDSHGVESFLPMHYIDGMGIHKGHRRLVPIIHNLIFVHSTREELDGLKQTNSVASTMRYIMDPATNAPTVVADGDMHNFMLVSGTLDDGLIYFSDEEIRLKVGDRCRITGGIFNGVEGEMIRLRGDRRIVVKLEGFMAVATAFIHPSMIEKI